MRKNWLKLKMKNWKLKMNKLRTLIQKVTLRKTQKNRINKCPTLKIKLTSLNDNL